MNRPFLTAHWRWLAMVNYEVAPEILFPLIPKGVVLDAHQGKYFVSLVGFLFEQTKVLGCRIPFHSDFEELNLRFYVRRELPGESRRGVVFVKEVVPRFWIARTAHLLYNENYVALPMRHGPESPGRVRYEWKFRGRWNHLSLSILGDPMLPEPGSDQEFITEHYWGYVVQRDGSTREYKVEHPQWSVWNASEVAVDCDAAGLYGERLARCFAGPPVSAFVADGSPISVHHSVRL